MRSPTARPRVKRQLRTQHVESPGADQALDAVAVSVDALHQHVGDNGVEHHALFTSARAGFAPASGGGTATYLRADGSWSTPPTGGGGVTDGDKGDVTVSGGGAVWTVDPGAVDAGKLASDAVTTAKVLDAAVTNAKLADMTGPALKGRTSGTGAPSDLTGTQATTMFDLYTSALKGLVPGSGGGTANFLRADGTWAAPSGGSGGSVDDMLSLGALL